VPLAHLGAGLRRYYSIEMQYNQYYRFMMSFRKNIEIEQRKRADEKASS
jgi:hypothetical protein